MTEQISAQQIFDTVWQRFVVEMAPRAIGSSGHCFYRRTGSDLRCAVGVLMTDDEASRAQAHGGPVGWLVKQDALPSRLLPHVGLLQDLQAAHDEGRVPGDAPLKNHEDGRTRFSSGSERASLLTRIANIHGLEVPS